MMSNQGEAAPQPPSRTDPSAIAAMPAGSSYTRPPTTAPSDEVNWGSAEEDLVRASHYQHHRLFVYRYRREMTPAMPYADPFIPVQAEVLSAIGETRTLFGSYLRIRAMATSPQSPELLLALKELQVSLHARTSDLRDLTDVVAAIELDPARYGLAFDEVARRRRLVDDLAHDLAQIQAEFDKVAGLSTPAAAAAAAADPDAPEGAYDAVMYGRQRQQQQNMLLREQADLLDGVSHTVGNLRAQAATMGTELQEQGELLADVDRLADRVGDRLAVGLRRVKEFVPPSSIIPPA
ncbi:MAG: hypothetical protein M1826_000884 [Phylliscum demangeonii]|nr:MAG: hypothetical protein M1826_000884 [Phylliscum demangeonii]